MEGLKKSSSRGLTAESPEVSALRDPALQARDDNHPSIFTRIDIAGPGFINLTLKSELWQAQIAVILKEGVGYGNSQVGQGRKVNIEYVSANPTGPMHVGHGRGAVVGDALALLLMKAGFNVTKEYYINDAGSQIGVLAESAFLRYREALGEDIGEIPAGLYPGDYLKVAGQGLADYYKDELLKKAKGRGDDAGEALHHRCDDVHD